MAPNVPSHTGPIATMNGTKDDDMLRWGEELHVPREDAVADGTSGGETKVTDAPPPPTTSTAHQNHAADRAIQRRFKELRREGVETKAAMKKAREEVERADHPEDGDGGEEENDAHVDGMDAEEGLPAEDDENIILMPPPLLSNMGASGAGDDDGSDGAAAGSNDGSGEWGLSGGDDLFPRLGAASPQNVDPPAFDAGDGPSMEIVPFDETKSKLEGLFANRPPAAAPVVEGGEGEQDDPAVVAKAIKRKRPTGLGNLGNTCFMNSTLQCLAHTPPIREYFLGRDHNGGDYEHDINADNPLGTGGELAKEFASLLREMWTVRGGDSVDVAYPRSFKHTLGKHAPQFVGYNQHDSQELAIYLLDALHEDTNRVRKKPFVEKPEQAEDEADSEAAAKAWGAHLQREDSHILESFVGQVKSRVQCPVEGCGRVSTTYDPCMYLSVPIPGSTDRTMKVTFVPLPKDKSPICAAELTIKLDKNATIKTLRRRVMEMARECYGLDEAELVEEDIVLADIFQSKVWSYYSNDDDGVDGIKDNDVTYAYQLFPLARARQELAVYKEKAQNQRREEDEEKKDDGNDSATNTASPSLSLLDPATRQELEEDPHKWHSKLEGFLTQPHTLYHLTNASRSTSEERLEFYGKLLRFIQKCKRCSDANATAGADNNGPSNPADDSALTLEEVIQTSKQFKNVYGAQDLALLDFCASQFMRHSNGLNNASSGKRGMDTSEMNEDGVVVQIQIKKCDSNSTPSYYGGRGGQNRFIQNSTSSESKVVGSAPIIARVPSSLTVGGLRKMLGDRFACALKTSDGHHSQGNLTGAGASEPELAVMNQVALSFDNDHKDRNYRPNSYNCDGQGTLGSVSEDDLAPSSDAATPQRFKFAKPSDKEENELVSAHVVDYGTIFVNWPSHLNDDLDEDMLCAKDEYLTEDQKKEREASLSNDGDGNKVSLMDCISKYCETEQLDETEMWYCNRCKEHVRAWKQFHLYKTPAILIIHLKRFHFSSTTHRRDKIDTLIDFPLENLDLREAVTDWPEGKEPIYDCYAVSNHFGGLGGGHYTAYARGGDGEWCNFDDSRVTSGVDESEVISSAAYCLYYKRKDVVSYQSYDESDDVMTSEEDKCTDIQRLDQETVMPVSPSPCNEEGGEGDENDGMDVDGVQAPEDGSTGSSTSVASYQTPRGSFSDDAEGGMKDGSTLDTQKKIISEEASALFDSVEITPEMIKEFREKCNSMGLDLQSDVGLTKSRLMSMYAMEVTPGIDSGEITIDSADILVGIPRSLGLTYEEGEEIIAGLSQERAKGLLADTIGCMNRGFAPAAVQSMEKLVRYAALVYGDLVLEVEEANANRAFNLFESKDWSGVDEEDVENQKSLLKIALGLSRF